MAKRYPGAEVFGLVASAEMLETAARAVARAGLCHRIRLAQGYAQRLQPGLFGQNRRFDRAVFSYGISMIPKWYQTLNAAARSLCGRGRLHVAVFGDFVGVAWPLAGLLRAWLSPFHVHRGSRSCAASNRGPMAQSLKTAIYGYFQGIMRLAGAAAVKMS
jgi:S-adenosylmethionine-diacylgycerolhomoserine-N-methlytransferase